MSSCVQQWVHYHFHVYIVIRRISWAWTQLLYVWFTFISIIQKETPFKTFTLYYQWQHLGPWMLIFHTLPLKCLEWEIARDSESFLQISQLQHLCNSPVFISLYICLQILDVSIAERTHCLSEMLGCYQHNLCVGVCVCVPAFLTHLRYSASLSLHVPHPHPTSSSVPMLHPPRPPPQVGPGSGHPTPPTGGTASPCSVPVLSLCDPSPGVLSCAVLCSSSWRCRSVRAAIYVVQYSFSPPLSLFAFIKDNFIVKVQL